VIFDSLVIDGIDDLRLNVCRHRAMRAGNREIKNQQSPTNQQSEITQSSMH
jgi:hypothetical protein